MGIYGPRTVFCLAVAGYPGCHEFLLMDDGKWVHVKETTGVYTALDVGCIQPCGHRGSA